ncbi:MAG: polysaccharide biosynthesis protein [Ruminococcus sp.]|nr:polysaccharide biosynthesis protein [Ruminococcus sp.]
MKLSDGIIKKSLLAVSDTFIVIFSALITNYILSFFNSMLSSKEMLIPIVTGTVCCILFLYISGAYSKLWRYSRKRDYTCCLWGTACGIASMWIFHLLSTGEKLSLAFTAIYGIISVMGIFSFRLILHRISSTKTKKVTYSFNAPRTMIIGGGRACKMILDEIQSSHERNEKENPAFLYEPVCIIDDNKAKIGSSIDGIDIVGTTDEIEKFAKEYKIDLIIVAIPSCIGDERTRILKLCHKTGIKTRELPFIGNLIFDENNPLLNQVREINFEKLLGRPPISFNHEEVQEFIRGKVCMVTGGGGSIGSELVRQIARYNPEKIIIVDIYENNAYEIQQDLKMKYNGELDLTVLIASVRDYYRMNQIYVKYKPQVVFHAAAHKHVPLMEDSPMEAIKNNVIGTFNVASLAQFHKIEKFVMISTDKAVNPTNVMGASKRCCEMIVQYLAQQHDGPTEFVTTRFGNVLGSNGSVIPLFKKQIEQGKPVTVTHRDIIRYFMTIPEAVSLVLQAASIAQGGEIFVLDMGRPVKIVTLAENLIRLYGKEPYTDVPIVFTGLRPGEKIKEELLMDEENLKKTHNKLIFIGKQIEIDNNAFPVRLRILRDAAEENDEPTAIQALHDMVPTFTTPNEFNNREIRKNEIQQHQPI